MNDSQEIESLGTLAGVLIALLVLLTATAWVSRLDLGHWGTLVAFAIALAKALLVLYFFMELKLTPRLVWVFAGAGFFWLAILAGSVWTDVITRIPLTLGK